MSLVPYTILHTMDYILNRRLQRIEFLLVTHTLTFLVLWITNKEPIYMKLFLAFLFNEITSWISFMAPFWYERCCRPRHIPIPPHEQEIQPIQPTV